MKSWLNRLLEEKGLDPELIVFEVAGKNGKNSIPLGCVLEAIFSTTKEEKRAIKRKIMMIDFMGGDITPFFNHLATGLAQ